MNNLKTFSRLEKEKEEGYQKEDLKMILNRVIKILYYRINQGKVEIVFEISESVEPIETTVTNLNQVFPNTLDNILDAVKERSEKKILVRIRHKNSTAQVKIEDNGCGFDSST